MDIPNLGLRIPSETLRRFWLMCAHHHGQILNSFQLAQSLGLSHTTVRSYVDILSQAFVLRVLYPCERNLKKRLVRSPKIYIRDSGLLHALLRLGSDQDLLGHPAYGPSWEGLVIESISTVLGEGWRAGFYRTSAGSKMDLVMEKGSRRLAFECKASSAPTVTRGFWSAVSDIQAEKNFVVAPVPQAYPLGPNTEVAPLAEVLARLRTES
jgi:predicted AAA+ superfamily ATPase